MREQIEVVYENGSFRPLGRLPAHLREHQRLTVTLEAPTGLTPGSPTPAPR